MIRSSLPMALFLLAAPAAAETVYALSPSEVASVIPAPVAERATPIADGPVAPRDRMVHGEVSMGIGTGGYRSIGGAALVPLSDDAWAAVSVETGQFGRRVYRRR